ncbi:putative PPM-type phosphatase domain, protein phosphatase 2C family [Helianthus anomalus]
MDSYEYLSSTSISNLLNDVLDAIPHGLNCDEWLQALPRSLVVGFVKTDKQFQRKGLTSGTTATFLIVDKWTVTVASVEDFRCILDTPDRVVSVLTVDHRLEENTEDVRLPVEESGETQCWRIYCSNTVTPRPRKTSNRGGNVGECCNRIIVPQPR